MVRDVVALSPSNSVDEAVNHYFLRYGFGGFPVMDGGRLLGMATLKEMTAVPQEKWGQVTVGEVFVPHDRQWEISPKEDVIKALELMVTEDKGRIAVIEKDRRVGLITRSGIALYIQIKGGE